MPVKYFYRLQGSKSPALVKQAMLARRVNDEPDAIKAVFCGESSVTGVKHAGVSPLAARRIYPERALISVTLPVSRQ